MNLLPYNENSKPIYLQIADRICDKIMAREYASDGRIQSVRASSAQYQVNANTMMRVYEYLSQNKIIQNQRGIGYYVSPVAKEQIEQMRERIFFDDEMKYFFSRLSNMDITPERLQDLYNAYLKEYNQ